MGVIMVLLTSKLTIFVDMFSPNIILDCKLKSVLFLFKDEEMGWISDIFTVAENTSLR